MNIVALRLRRTSFATVAVCLATIAAYNLIPRTEAESAAALPPMLAATKTASLAGGDVDLDGLADPGDTITYTVTVQNNAPVGVGNDATGVVITDALQNITTLVGMSVNAQPIAGNESFSVTGNVSISVPDGVSDLLANDIDPDTGSGAALTMVSANVTSANCLVASCPVNNVVINANGSFTYNPPPGFEGPDTFTYTIRDNGPDGVGGNADDATATGTVTLNISGMVWFINNGSPACTTLATGCGRLSNPFSTLAAFQAINNGTGNNPAANDSIFVFQSATAYAGGVTLLGGQRFIGQDSTSTLAAITGISLPTFSTAFPAMIPAAPATTIQNAGGNGVTLGATNTLNGFTASDSSGFAILGSSYGTVTVNDVIISANGAGLSLTTGTFAGAGFSSITSGGGATGINLNAMSGTFTVPTVSINAQTGDGITITNCPGTVTINAGTVGNTNDPGGNAVEVNGSNGNVTIAASLTKTTAGKIVLVTARTGNTVALSGNISATGAVDNGIDVNNNTAGIVNFTGQTQTLTTGAGTGVNLVTNGTGVINFAPVAGGNGLDINTTSGAGLNATGGGTVTVQSSGNSIKTEAGTALNVTSTTIGALGLTFECISAGRNNTGGAACNLGSNVAGPAKGIILNTTGASGGLSVTGTGTTVGSGGTIQGTDTRGAEVISSFNLSLKNMNFTNANDVTDGGAAGVCDDLVAITCNAAVYLRTVTGFATLDNLDITGTMVEDGVVAISVANLTFNNSLVDHAGNDPLENGFTGENLSGTVTVNNTDIAFSEADGFKVINTNTAANVSVSGSSFRDSQTGGPTCPGVCNGEGGFHFRGLGSGTITINLLNSSFLRNNTQGIQVFSGGTATINLDIVGNTIDPGPTGVGTGIDINANTNSILNFNITGNPTIQSRGGAAVNITSFLSGHIEGRVNNNPDIEVLSSAGLPIKITPQETSQAIVLVDNNIVSNINGTEDTMIDVQSRFQTARADVTITRNTVTGEPTGIAGVNLISGSSTVGESNITCAAVGGTSLGNNVTNAVGNTLRAFRIRVSDLSNTNRVFLQGFTTDAATTWINRSNLPAVPAEVVVSLTGTAVAPTAPPGGGLCQVVDTPTDFLVAQTIEPRTINASFAMSNRFALWDLTTSEQDELVALNRVRIFDEDRIFLTRPLAEVEGEETLEPRVDMASDPTDTNPDQNSGTAPTETYLLAAILNRLMENISPTVYSQEKKETAAPEAGETITINGGGAGFTLPAQKTIVVTFKATVNNGPFLSGVNSVTNKANVTAAGGINFDTNTTTLALDAAPDLQVTVSDGGTTTQPGAVIQYTTTYQNNTAPNGQNAAAVRVTQTVPTNTTFNATVSGGGWSCPDGSPAMTSCTFDVGAVNAGAAPAAINFAVNVLPLLSAGAIQISDTATIAENPVNANGTDRVPANNTSIDTTNIIGNWLGTTSVWETPSNWSNGILPPAGNNISLPVGTTAPVLSSSPTVGLLTLGTNITINAGFTLSATGNVALGANNVLGAGTLSLGTASAITRTTGQVNATLQKNFAGPGPLFVMPVGTTGAYSPLNVTVTAGTGQLTVGANTGVPPSVPLLDATKTLNRYWTLSGSGITSNLTFNYLNVDVPGTTNEALWNVIRVTGNTAVRYPPGPDIILNAAANTFTVNNVSVYSHWTAGEPLAPTAAQVGVSGRVMTADGRGVSGARVALTNQSGQTVYAITNPFGYYRFVGVGSGQTYLASVNHKRYTFASRSVSVSDEVVGFDFLPEP
jgi:uncharacterized repeat protein (TIGR01451 family)